MEKELSMLASLIGLAEEMEDNYNFTEEQENAIAEVKEETMQALGDLLIGHLLDNITEALDIAEDMEQDTTKLAKDLQAFKRIFTLCTLNGVGELVKMVDEEHRTLI